ncbi:MAG: hypothetical protein J5716_07420 [Alphaproteobacteria bacterium]|nr:hypothetical protein [Alphaproteobacteria bacterium]
MKNWKIEKNRISGLLKSAEEKETYSWIIREDQNLEKALEQMYKDRDERLKKLFPSIYDGKREPGEFKLTDEQKEAMRKSLEEIRKKFAEKEKAKGKDDKAKKNLSTVLTAAKKHNIDR